MPQVKALSLSFLCLLLSFAAFPQTGTLQKSGTRVIDSSYIALDTLSIVPGSFYVDGIDSGDYRVDYLHGGVHILNPSVKGKTMTFRYACFSFDLTTPVQHRSESLNIRQKGSIYHTMTPIVPKTEDVFTSGGTQLQSTGSISRGVSIGTNQDFVLNSTLNLQLSGKLSDKLEITANITDKNVPIQPEGNTQSINDFDKIFIRLNYDKRFMLDAGDIEVSQQQDAFMRLTRKFMGMAFAADNSLKGGNHLTNSVGGGVNKGKFVRQTVEVQNGVQGPYRLTGEQGETNITILAGSERVYMDGELLVRGQENDYVIDYNTAELSFTVKHLMTAEKRIIVEYEYSDRHYARYNLFTFNEFTHEKNHKLKLKLNFYHEQDLKNRSIQPELNDDQKLFLSTLPSSVQTAWYYYADSALLNTDEVLYEPRDTVVQGVQYHIYVYSTRPDVQLYRLSFSMVGEQMGNYVLTSNTANGRVFAWVAPVEGVPQGNYEPVQLLTAPETHDMATIAASYEFSKNTGLDCELALSNHDKNNFSKNNEHNVGFAGMLSFYHSQELKRKSARVQPWMLKTKIHYEFIHKDFSVLESTREVEFQRNYNLDEEYSHRFSEQMAQLTLALSQDTIGSLRYDLNWFSRFGNMNAVKNELTADIHQNGWRYNTLTSYLFSVDSIQKTNFVKTYNTLSKTLKKIEIGLIENFEYNALRTVDSGTLRPGSQGFNEALVFLKNNDSLPYLFHISYKNRVESRLNQGIMSMGAMSNEAKASFELAKLKNNRIKADVTYRNMQIRNEQDRYNKENYFLAGLEYTGRFWRNALVLNTYYEAGSGLEQKMVFSYLKVAEGQGVYVWNDYNGNGIEELDEFEVAAFRDQANYIKVWQNGTDYVNTHNNQFVQSIQLRPANVWSGKKDFRRVLARFSDAANLKIVQKNNFQHNANAFNPFYLNMVDTNVVSGNLSFTNTLSYNHKSIFSIDFVTQLNRSKNLLYYGTDRGSYDMQQLVFRANAGKMVNLKTDYLHSVKTNYSEFLSSRCFAIEEHCATMEVIFQYKNKLQVKTAYLYSFKRNRQDFQEAQQHKLDAEFKYKMVKKGNLTVAAAYYHIKYNDEENSSLSYEMLEGLSMGHNVTWDAKYEANITDFLQINLLYQGRYTQGHKVVHTGSMEVRAHF